MLLGLALAVWGVLARRAPFDRPAARQVVFGLVVGYLLDHGFGYAVVFGMVSTFHVLAFLLILVCIRTVRPIGEAVYEHR